MGVAFYVLVAVFFHTTVQGIARRRKVKDGKNGPAMTKCYCCGCQRSQISLRGTADVSEGRHNRGVLVMAVM